MSVYVSSPANHRVATLVVPKLVSINRCLTSTHIYCMCVYVGLISGLNLARPLSALNGLQTKMDELLSVYVCVYKHACVQASLVF